MHRESCKELAWDSEFFGIRIAQHSGNDLTEESAEAALDFCRQREVDCLYLLLSDDPAVRCAAEAGDLPALRQIARVSHRDSRFYSDPHFDRNRCDALYETWITRSCEGWADRTFVALEEGRLSGYITCKLSDQGVGSVGLFAVGEAARGKGHGTDLIKAALADFADAGMHSAEVVTQLRSIQGHRRWFHA